MIKQIFCTVSLLTSLSASASIKIDEISRNNDLAGFHISNTNNEQSFSVFYSSELKSVALESINLLDKIYTEVAANAGIEPRDTKWAELAFVTDENYIPPRDSSITRWKIYHPVANHLDDEAIDEIYRLMSHEQVHAIQGLTKCELPRWFTEGQATWVESKAAIRWNLESFRSDQLDRERKYKDLDGKVNLDSWGRVRVKIAAIKRQLTPEQLKKLEEDPTYQPQGSFSFGPDDVEVDLSNEKARYFSSFKVFEFLEKELGEERLKSLFNDVYKMQSCKSQELKDFIRSNYQTKVDSFFLR